MPGIAPTFTPGSGWLQKLYKWSPGTTADIADRLQSAYPCAVFRMREFGMRLPAQAMLTRPPVTGALLCNRSSSSTEMWEGHVFRPDMQTDLLPKLLGVQLVRENDGVRLYQGEEWDKAVKKHYPQTWLCTPTVEIGLEILAKMER